MYQEHSINGQLLTVLRLSRGCILRAACVATTLGALLCSEDALAATPIVCSEGVNALLAREDGWLRGIGTRIVASDSLGFSSFTMRDGFDIATTPLGLPAVKESVEFIAPRANANAYSGFFHEVIPSRGDANEDRWRVWIGRGGNFWLMSMTWTNVWIKLPAPVCYLGDQNQLVVVANVAKPGFGHDFWTFAFQYDKLI